MVSTGELNCPATYNDILYQYQSDHLLLLCLINWIHKWRSINLFTFLFHTYAWWLGFFCCCFFIFIFHSLSRASSSLRHLAQDVCFCLSWCWNVEPLNDMRSQLWLQAVLTSPRTSLIGTSIKVEPSASMWTSTLAPSAVGRCSWDPTWRNLSGWITAPQLWVLATMHHSPPPPLPWPSLTSHTHILQVFHLLTSSVNVVINGSGSRVRPAQAFVVPCGKKSNLWHITLSFHLGEPPVQLIALATVVCSHRSSLQHPECLGAAGRVVFHQDDFGKLRLTAAAWTWGKKNPATLNMSCCCCFSSV